MDDINDARLLANPYLLATEKITVNKDNTIDEIPIHQKLKYFLNDSYKKIYFSDKKNKMIKIFIEDQIDNIIIDNIISKCLDDIINEVTELNKFDFCIPFD